MKDTAVQKLMALETARQETTINLIASENYISDAVKAALASDFSNKYAEGYVDARYYEGNEIVDQLEQLCIDRALAAFGLQAKKWHVNVQALSGSPANLAVLAAILSAGDPILSLDLSHGGHLSHGYKVSITGKFYKQIPYTVHPVTGLLDYALIQKLATEHRPRVIIAGYSAYPGSIDFRKFRAIADSVGAYLLCDIAHIAGLVAAGAHTSPFPYADIVTTTTHKTLRGPRGALIFAARASKIAAQQGIDLPKKIDSAVFPGLQGGPHMNQIAAIATALLESSQPAFRTYIDRVVVNAATLADELQRLGWNIVTGGTQNHLMLIDTYGTIGVPGDVAAAKLAEYGIICNKNMIPFDIRNPKSPSGIRLGTPAMTTRGWRTKEFKNLARSIDEILRSE